MSFAIEFFCDDPEDLLDHYPELRLDRVRGGSDVAARLLFVEELYDYYDGEWSHLFDCLEEKFGLEDNLFGPLLEAPSVAMEPEDAVAYLERLLGLIEEHAGEIPRVYSFVDAETEEAFAERILGPLRAEGGFDHCALIDEEQEEAVDLRGEERIEAPGRTLRIVQESVVAHAGADFSRMLDVARTARSYGHRFVLEVN